MTQLLYLLDSSLKNAKATIEEIQKTDGENWEIILDKTIFFVKGGGQPSDRGIIFFEDNKMTIDSVFKDKETSKVYHGGKIEGAFKKGMEVELVIDDEFRYLNSRLHSYGHLIDQAIWELKVNEIEPGKGYHYSDGPYVEYVGDLDEIRFKYIQDNLQSKLDELIQKDTKVNIMHLDKKDLDKYCRWVIKGVPLGNNVRVVEVCENNWMPCGGTHIEHLSELKGIKIRKMKYKKGILKVSYTHSV